MAHDVVAACMHPWTQWFFISHDDDNIIIMLLGLIVTYWTLLRLLYFVSVILINQYGI